MHAYRVAVVGATGAVGSTVLEILAERDNLPIRELVPFASERSEGTPVSFAGEQLACQRLTEEAVEGFDLVFSSAGGGVSREWAPRFEQAGAIVIDKSSSWRMEPGVSLVVPEVNPGELSRLKRRIISSPNCSTMQLVVALNPIREAAGLTEIVVSTYQSVSGTGRQAITELCEQTQAALNHKTVTPHVYPHQIAFNVVPQVETFRAEDEGYTTEEIKIMQETRKIFGITDEAELPITATCVRVPVITCHSESVRIETAEELSVEDCRELLRSAEGVTLMDAPLERIYPLAVDATGKDDVFVGRIRRDLGKARCLNLWIVGDNLRKGAALNAVQIAERLHGDGLLGTAGPVASAAGV